MMMMWERKQREKMVRTKSIDEERPGEGRTDDVYITQVNDRGNNKPAQER